MSDSLKPSFQSVLLLVFLLPLFFIPTALVPLGIAKTLLMFLVAFVALVSLLIYVWRDGRLVIPKSRLLWGALVLPLVYVVSALGSYSPKLSLYGYGFELGTAASIAICAALFLIAALSFRDKARLIKGYVGLFLSFLLVMIFALVKVVSGGSWLTLGTFAGNMSSPIGIWSDLATALGVLAVISTLALGMLPLGALMGTITWLSYIISVVLLAVVGFSTMWALVLGASLVLLVYFLTVEKGTPSEGAKMRQGVWAAALLVFVSLIFVWNPTFSTRSLSAVVSNAAHVNNIDVRPSLSATLGVAHSVLAKNPVLGSGPNTFDRDWLIYKSGSVNNTAFWSAAFPFGFGFLSTAVATTGILGTLAWVLFLGLFLSLGGKILSKSPSARADRFVVLTPYLIALLLWLACFLYVPSIVILALAFIFTGLSIGAADATGILSATELNLSKGKLARFSSTLAMLALIVLSLGLGAVLSKKTLAAAYFEKALADANAATPSIDAAEADLTKAIGLSPADPYYIAMSQVELSRANAAISDTKSSDDEKKTAFQTALGKSIASIQSAISLNPTYSNWLALGNLYESLVPAPLSVTGAYENTLSAYQSAKAINPATPEVPLLLARLELDHKDVDAARKHIDEALSLKPDYADAYFLLSQLEVSQNNLTEAIQSAETVVVLTPNNAGVLFELGLLQFSNKDYAGAKDALGRALAITPDYANAKYYMALTLDKLGEKTDAIALFEDLLKSNPGNAAIMSAIENLKAGKDALAQSAASVTKSKTAPVSGQ